MRRGLSYFSALKSIPIYCFYWGKQTRFDLVVFVFEIHFPFRINILFVHYTLQEY